jgi:hypothetical protein
MDGTDGTDLSYRHLTPWTQHMHETFTAIENSGIGTWIRESPSMFAYTGFITVHAIGLSFAVGMSCAIATRVLGFPQALPLDAIRGFFGVAWVGVGMCVVSGVGLVISAASKDLPSPVFLTKLTFIGIAAVLTRRLQRQCPTRASSGLALAVIVMWTLAIIAGRLNEYPALMGVE